MARIARSARWLLSGLVVLVLGCSDDAASPDEGTGGTGDADVYPPECTMHDVSPFQSGACLDGLSRACRAHADAESCAAAPPLSFGDGFTIACEWAKVVTFSDAEACTVESVRGRCEAGVRSLGGACGDVCTGDALVSNLSAFPELREIVDMCDGPLGAWSAVDPGEETEVGSCADNVSPPAPPLCDCAPVACDAE